MIASPERKRILAENRARLTEEVLARLTPSERIIVPYVANGPVYFPDLRLHPALGGARADFRPPLRALLGAAGTVRHVRP